MGWYEYKPYVPVAQRRAQAAREVAKRLKKGQTVSPVQVEGRTIASTFWGRAWCTNLEGYSDYANRLPRGRTYVRNGLVIDLKIEKGRINALVSGSEFTTSGSTSPRCRNPIGWPSRSDARARSARWSSCCRASSRRG